MPKVSIVLPVYNGEQFLRESIESIIRQTYIDWELIIVNDCSTDNSLKIAEEYAKLDTRIKIINNKENKKLPESLNIGFREAKGEYYTWTSDDNEYYPNAIEKMLNFLENNKEYGMVHAISKVTGIKNEEYWGEIVTYPISLLNFPSPGACFLYKAEIAQKVGEYDAKCFYMEDHDFWLRFLLEAPIGTVSEILYEYRRHKDSLTVKSNDKAERLRILLTLKYLNEYKEKFPQYNNELTELYGLAECIYNEDDLTYNNLKNKYDKKTLYLNLKKMYKLTKSDWQAKKIMELGIKYFFKGLKLRLKYGGKNESI